MLHLLSRVRHETKRRLLAVQRVDRLSPTFVRVTFGGSELAGFTSAAFDDHVKLFFQDEHGETAMRDFTPRRHDPLRDELAIDFALHANGPAARWAMQARPGDSLEIGGPRGSMIVPDDFDWWILIGDETALPAIGRRVETLGAGRLVHTVVAVPGEADEQAWTTVADHRPCWVHRPLHAAADPAPLLEAVRALDWPATGDGYVFIAAEAGVARALRDHVVGERRHPAAWMRAAGYWTIGRADGHVRLGEP